MFALESPFWQTVLVASVVYLAVVITIRVVPKRYSGHLSPNDMIALVMIGSLATMGMSLHAKSVGDFLLMIGVVLLWGHVFNWLEFYFPWMRRVAQDTPTPVIRDGRLLRKNMEREMITEEELIACLRKHGLSDVHAVKEAVLEVDGRISVVRFREEEEEGNEDD